MELIITETFVENVHRNEDIELLPSFGQIHKRKLKSNHAFIGDRVLFTRKNRTIEGLVVAYRVSTVIVEIPPNIAHLLELETNLTVVNHKNYEVL